MTALARTLGMLAAIVASIWLVAALVIAFVLHGHRAERAARYVEVDAARSFATQGRPEFVALRGHVAEAGLLALRRGHDAEATWYAPLLADQGPSTRQVHWIARYTGTSLPDRDDRILGRHAADEPPRVVRDEFEHAGTVLATDAVVIDWIPSRQGVVLDRDMDTLTFGEAMAGLLSVIVVLGFGMLAIMNARASGASSPRTPP
jgi:hypothetical protein